MKMWSRVASFFHTLRERERDADQPLRAYFSSCHVNHRWASNEPARGLSWIFVELKCLISMYIIIFVILVRFFSFSRRVADGLCARALFTLSRRSVLSASHQKKSKTMFQWMRSLPLWWVQNIQCQTSVQEDRTADRLSRSVKAKKNLIDVKSRINKKHIYIVESSFFDKQLYLSTDGSADDESSLINDWRFSK